MKILSAKRLILVTCVAAAMFMFGCKPESEAKETPDTPAYTITAPDGKEGTITISDDGKTITLQPEETDVEYTITGNFEGQIINKTKGTVIILNNAKLKNTEGKAVIYGALKTEIKIEKDSINSITVTGKDNTVYEEGEPDYSKAAVLCNKRIEIGGSGSCSISCEKGHGVKGDEIELKGKGNYVFGPVKDSAINCNDFVVKAERSFTATFKEAKNGIKADNTISIASGTFNFGNIKKVALKTDTSADDAAGETKEHKITLKGGDFTFTDCGKKYETEKNCFTKSETVIGDFTNPL